MKKILIIEDDALIGKTIQMKIQYAAKKNGIEADVLRVFNGEDGLNSILEKKPDLIVIDLMMPKKSGFEVLEDIKKSKVKDNGAPHIMVLTNLLGEKNKVIQLGASAYFVKSDTSIEQIADYVCKQLKD